MYDVKFIYQDYRHYTVEVEEEELESFLDAIRSNKPYFDRAQTIGFWLPPESLRCALILKKTDPSNQEKESLKCPQNQSSEQELASLN